jgi:hypothetical protein
MDGLSDFRKAYETAKGQLAELVAEQERLEKKKILLRKTIEALALQCEAEDILLDPSPEATSLLEHTSLSDDIRAILRTSYPQWLRPNMVKQELQRLGRDLKKYRNPQATIHMVLKRLVQGHHAEEMRDAQGKQIYRAVPDLRPLARMRATSPREKEEPQTNE